MPVPSADHDRLESVVAGILGPVQRVEVLAEGTSGLSYLVSAARRQYVAKLFFEDAQILNSVRTQYRLLESLASQDVSPVPVGFDEDAGVLITEFVPDAKPVSSDVLGDAGLIVRIALVLRRLHSASGQLPAYDPVRAACRYLDTAGGTDALSDGDRSHLDELIELAAAFGTESGGVCHNDLVAENILIGERITLIDFDFAASAPPILDLANFAEMNRFSAGQAEALCRAYYGREVPYPAVEFARVRRLNSLLAHLWSLASARAGTDIVAQYRISDV